MDVSSIKEIPSKVASHLSHGRSLNYMKSTPKYYNKSSNRCHTMADDDPSKDYFTEKVEYAFDQETMAKMLSGKRFTIKDDPRFFEVPEVGSYDMTTLKKKNIFNHCRLPIQMRVIIHEEMKKLKNVNTVNTCIKGGGGIDKNFLFDGAYCTFKCSKYTGGRRWSVLSQAINQGTTQARGSFRIDKRNKCEECLELANERLKMTELEERIRSRVQDMKKQLPCHGNH